ncbi:DUF1963 domain-containing protein [Achromobacter sp.]|uniref:DUF1963 domain-containing protein n=1 Tax=Achromobacter sp. TaxID=134375 RepID=UPI0028A6D51A|nr:DUF1963 domain-containing protein [Achromobacter sp.]
MNAIWGLSGYLPLLFYGLLAYSLLRILPKWIKRKRKGDVAPPSSHPAGPSFSASTTPTINQAEPQAAVSESVSVVLRRQVPPGAVESARSWLGGLPRMPDGVEWPRSLSSENPQRGERPLHFLAQICCSDLPRELWGGLGPRQGWLLVFIDPNQGCPKGSDAFCIMHLPQLGPEREAPSDLGPVHDGVYGGGSYDWLPKDDVPSTWRRWPADLVSFPNVLHRNEHYSFATPEGFAETLYDGASVFPYEDLEAVRPYTFGQALRAVHGLAKRMRTERGAKVDQHAYAVLRAEGSLDPLRESLTIQLATAVELAESDYRTLTVDGLKRSLALVESCDTVKQLEQRLEGDLNQWRRWRLSVAEDCDEVAAQLAGRPLEMPFSQEDWSQLQSRFDGREFHGFELCTTRDGGTKQLELRERWEQASLTIPEGTTEEALADWLNPETRPRVPADRLADLEAAARSLRSNRPHRMGGYHDGVQSDAVEGPQNQLLLLQIASDNGMDWCWGDVGAYYFWIRPEHLAAGDFSNVEMRLESH